MSQIPLLDKLKFNAMTIDEIQNFLNSDVWLIWNWWSRRQVTQLMHILDKTNLVTCIILYDADLGRNLIAYRLRG